MSCRDHHIRPARARRLAALLVGGALLAATIALVPASAPVAAQAEAALPSLPLPDCMANGLNSVDPATDCEGTFAVINRPDLPAPDLSDVKITPSVRALDFRLDADRAQAQDITLTWPVPDPFRYDDSGVEVEAFVERFWPETIERGGSYVQERVLGEEWDTTTELRLGRLGECAYTDEQCTYRVQWSPYEGTFSTRLDEPALWRIGLPWTLRTRRVDDGGPGGDRGDGATSFAFSTQPPPALVAVATTRRLGPAQFEFSAKGSGPGGIRTDVKSWQWYRSNGRPTFSNDREVFTKDFAEEYPGTPIDQSGAVDLLVIDRWERVAFALTTYSILSQVGTSGPLAITSFEVVRVVDGVAHLRAVVKNVSGGPISNVGLVGTRAPTGTVGTEPVVVQSLSVGAETVFTVTTPVDDLDELTVQVQALGSSPSGPVRSTPADARVGGGPQPTGSTTTTTASAPGGDRVEVASNDGFAPGDYAQLGSGATSETRRVEALGSLIFTAPLAHAHPAGTPVVEVDPPGGDTAGPTISVAAPTAGQVVVQGDPVAIDYTCADAGVGVESCGGDGPGDGSPLATEAVGPGSVTIEAWDANGNATRRTVAYTVAGLPNRRFVALAISDLLDREATTTELDVLGVGLDAGTLTRAGILTILTTSPESVAAVVQRFYRDLLGRDGEPAGVAFWVDLIRSGRRSVASVAASFYGSPEYVTGPGGGTPSGWITALYRDLLGREPDTDGLAYWTGLDLGRHGIAHRFFQARESRAARVEALYLALLRRPADADGLAFWIDRIGRIGDLGVARALAASPEYDARAQQA